MRLRRDERGIVTNWLVKLVIGFVVFGVIIFDVGSILVNYFTLDSSSDDVALAVSLVVGSGERVSSWTDNEIYLEALKAAEDPEAGVSGAKVLKRGTGIDPDGTIHVRLRRSATTLVVSRIGAIEKWARATANGQAGTT